MRMIILAAAIGFMTLEYLFSRHARRDEHDLRESAASLGVAFGRILLRGVEGFAVVWPFAFAYEHRLLDFDQMSALALVALFVGVEFFYYWHHRASHRVRWLWATHCVHHSSTRLNYTAAVRLGWTGGVSGGFVFFLPLAFIGFHPVAIVGMLTLNLLYQFFIHTELGPRLGFLEHVLNTPAHHRVHHASNDSCLDKNFGGVLILFDRLFGTFAEAPRREAMRYGLVGARPSYNPLRIAFGEWPAMLADARAARDWRGVLAALFAPPGAARPASESVHDRRFAI
ncbi:MULTISPECIES: sterol desaturase family protein [Methylosinus]|nr:MULTISPECIES: sterol desaturase family protein [Methylosinus]